VANFDPNDCYARQGDGKHDFLELYCGNGNFTLPLAQYFGQAFATEIVRQSVKVHYAVLGWIHERSREHPFAFSLEPKQQCCFAMVV
jgi:hypothetical protein